MARLRLSLRLRRLPPRRGHLIRLLRFQQIAEPVAILMQNIGGASHQIRTLLNQRMRARIRAQSGGTGQSHYIAPLLPRVGRRY